MNRIQVLSSHLFPESSSSSSLPSVSYTSGEEVMTSKIVSPQYKDLPLEERKLPPKFTPEQIVQPQVFTLPDKTEVTIHFRRYIEGKDDKAYQLLDSLCTQGKTTHLETRFWMDLSWDKILPFSESWIAYDPAFPGEMISCTRSFRKGVMINGMQAPLSYHFLLRVHPKYQGCGIGVYMERIMTIMDNKHGIRFILGYVIEDNTASLGLQKRMTKTTTISEMKKFLATGVFMNVLNQQTVNKAGLELKMMKCPTEQANWVRKILAKHQLVPIDQENIFSNVLSKGTALAIKNGEPVASLSIWNSGAVRSSRMKPDTEFLRNACMFYNIWVKEDLSQEQRTEYLSGLMWLVSRDQIDKKGHDFSYIFFHEDEQLAASLTQYAEWSLMWKVRVWNWDASFDLDSSYGICTAYDPRDSLN